MSCKTNANQIQTTMETRNHYNLFVPVLTAAALQKESYIQHAEINRLFYSFCAQFNLPVNIVCLSFLLGFSLLRSF